VSTHNAPLASAIHVEGLPAGIRAFTTTRAAGSFGLVSSEPTTEVQQRWSALQDDLAGIGVPRLASATQVHGADVVRHGSGWRGWLRQRGVDGHISNVPGTALAVTVADCTPVFIAHPVGVIAALHAGWRGTAAGILRVGLDAMSEFGCPAAECSVHLGPSICGGCYEVGPEVFEALTGSRPPAKGLIDVRAILADQAARRGVRELTVSEWCTRHHNDQLYSHRAGDAGRALGVIVLPA
jgi:YfiH family protein